MWGFSIGRETSRPLWGSDSICQLTQNREFELLEQGGNWEGSRSVSSSLTLRLKRNKTILTEKNINGENSREFNNLKIKIDIEICSTV